jgi:hypothetical protein
LPRGGFHLFCNAWKVASTGNEQLATGLNRGFASAKRNTLHL